MIPCIFGNPISQDFPKSPKVEGFHLNGRIDRVALQHVRTIAYLPNIGSLWAQLPSASTNHSYHRESGMSWKPPKFLQELEVIRGIRCVFFLGGKLRLTVASATNCVDYLEQFYLPSTKQHFPAISSLLVGILFRRKVRGFHHLDLQLLTIFQLKSCPMYLGWWKTAYVTNLQCQ